MWSLPSPAAAIASSSSLRGVFRIHRHGDVDGVRGVRHEPDLHPRRQIHALLGQYGPRVLVATCTVRGIRTVGAAQRHQLLPALHQQIPHGFSEFVSIAFLSGGAFPARPSSPFVSFCSHERNNTSTGCAYTLIWRGVAWRGVAGAGAGASRDSFGTPREIRSPSGRKRCRGGNLSTDRHPGGSGSIGGSGSTMCRSLSVLNSSLTVAPPGMSRPSSFSTRVGSRPSPP